MKHLRICALALALFTAQATLPSCLAGYEQGTAVTLAVSGALDGAVDAGGRAIRIDRAFLHVSSAELVACEERAERLRWVSVARADHTGPGAIERGAFVALHEGPRELGVLSPVPGTYCSLRVTLQPADASTEGVGPHEGETVVLEGEWEGGALLAAAPGNAIIDVPLEAPLSITRERPEAALELSFDVAGALGRIDASADPFDLGLDLIVHLDDHASCALRGE